MSKKNKPIVSCLCISDGRPIFLKKTIKCFMSQTYPSKELIILSQNNNKDYREIINSEEFSELDIRYYTTKNSKKLSLGELRNLAIEKANGDFICNWDDDDWHHMQRIEIQVKEALDSKKNGSILAYCILYDALAGQGYVSHPFFHPATILFKKNVIDDTVRYPPLNLQEDLHFLVKINKRNVLRPIINPALYIYVYHGSNSWTSKHFRGLFNEGKKFSPEISTLIKKIVDNQYTCEESSKLLTQNSFLEQLDYMWWYSSEFESEN